MRHALYLFRLWLSMGCPRLTITPRKGGTGRERESGSLYFREFCCESERSPSRRSTFHHLDDYAARYFSIAACI